MKRPGRDVAATCSLRMATAGTIVMTGAVIAAMDWWPSPLNRNIEHTPPLERVPSTAVHGSIAVLAAVAVLRGPRWTRLLVPVWFGTVLASAVLNWWVPYIVARYPGEIYPSVFAEEYAGNLSVLPVLAGRPVVPDVQHTLIHTLVAASTALSAAVVLAEWRPRQH